MAKTLLAPPIAGIRGTLGAMTYSANQAGTYVKLWAPPTNPKSPNQMLQRSNLAQMPELWRALTPVERTAWDTFAALPAQELFDSLGQSYFICGWLWFVKINVRLLRVARATRDAPPIIARPAAPTIDAFRVSLPGTDTDLCVGGVAAASSFTPGFPASVAFNDILTNAWVSLSPDIPGWITYTLAAPKVARRYDVYINAAGFASNFKDWTFQGKNNGGWDTLHTVTGFTPPAQAWYRFFIDNDTAYTTYRWNVTDTFNPAPGFISAYELAIFEGLIEDTVVIYPEDEFTTVAYDIIMKISQVASQSKAVQYPGYLEVLAKQTPSRWQEEFQTELTHVFGTILEGRRWFAHIYRQTTDGIRSAATATANNTQA